MTARTLARWTACRWSDRKMIELRRFANAKWGEGGWELAASYGDHHSDRALFRRR